MSRFNPQAPMVFRDFLLQNAEWGMDLEAVGNGGMTAQSHLIRDLVRAGFAISTSEFVTIPSTDLARLALEDDSTEGFFAELLLPDIYTGLVHLDLKGPMADGNWTLSFPSTIAGTRPMGLRGFSVEGLVLTLENPSEMFAVSPYLHLFLVTLQKAREDWKRLSLRQQYTLVSRIQQEAGPAGVLLSESLKETKVLVPQKIRLKLQEVTESARYTVAPFVDVPGLAPEEFARAFTAVRDVNEIYTITGTDGHKAKLVFDPEQQSVLVSVKKNRNMDSMGLRNMLKDPPADWTDELVDTSDLFSDRVLGWGLYRAKATPFVSKFKSEWLPGISMESEDGQTFTSLFDSLEKIEELEQAIREAQEQDRQDVIYQGVKLDRVEAERLASGARKQWANRLETAPISDESGMPSRYALLIKDNIETVEYDLVTAPVVTSVVSYEIPGLAQGISLKPYQTEGVGWLMGLFKAQASGAILADDMGLGKTLQILSFLQVLTTKSPIKVMVVAPVSLLVNWQAELQKFFPEGPLRFIDLNQNRGLLDFLLETPTKFDFTIAGASFEFMRMNQKKLGTINWDILILDEAQKIKNPTTLVTQAAKAMKGKFKIAVTGTPVENSFQDLWSIADFAIPGSVLGSTKDFSQTYGIREEDSEESVEAKGKAVREALGPFFHRRIKADVLTDLPPKKVHWVEKGMPGLQERSYNQILREPLDLKPSGTGDLERLFAIRKVSDHPLLLESHREWYASADADSAKLIALKEVLDREVLPRGHKALVFAEYKKTQRIIARALEEWYGLDPFILNGDTPASGNGEASRLGMIKAFSAKPKFDVLILSPVAAGVGLNIVAASHVIHYSRHWNPAKEDQATDRAYRIGQTNPVHVWYPIATHPQVDSFDLVLAKLLDRKQNLKKASLYPSNRLEVRPADFAFGSCQSLN